MKNRYVIEYLNSDGYTFFITSYIPVSTNGTRKELQNCLDNAFENYKSGKKKYEDPVMFYGSEIINYDELVSYDGCKNYTVLTLDEFFKSA